MELKKLCRCGKVIDYTDKYCDKCTDKYEQDIKYKNRLYDKQYRKNKEIYHSKEWVKLVELCKQRYQYIDIYEYYVNHQLVYGNLCHHIMPVEENKDRIYDLDNLIYLSNSSHALIHSEYDKSDKTKKKMQKILIDCVERWKQEGRGS